MPVVAKGAPGLQTVTPPPFKGAQNIAAENAAAIDAKF
jgi:hypothetical protein